MLVIMKPLMKKIRAMTAGMGQIALALVFLAALSLPALSDTQELTDKRFAKAPTAKDYPNAGFIIVLDEITFKADELGNNEYLEHDAIKFFTDAGIKEAGTLYHAYDSSSESIEVLQARTITPEGKVIPAKDENIKDVPLIENSPMHESIRCRVISFPELKPGCISEYTIKTKRSARADKHWWAVTYLQNVSPMLSSEFTVLVPKGAPFQWKCTDSSLRPSKSEYGKFQKYYWKSGKTMPIAAEAEMPAIDNYLSRIDICNFASWNELSQALAKSFKVSDDSSIDMLCARIASASDAPEKRVNDICAWMVKEHTIKPNTEEIWKARPLKELANSKILTATDVAVLAQAMLKKVGISSAFVYGTSYSYDDLKNQLPSPKILKQPMLEIDLGAKKGWIDATLPGALLDAPPGGFQDVGALRIAEHNGGIFQTPQAQASDNTVCADMEAIIDRSGRGELAMEMAYTGAMAGALRSSIGWMSSLSPSERDMTASFVMQEIEKDFLLKTTPYSAYMPESADPDEPFRVAGTVVFPSMARFNKSKGSYQIITDIFGGMRLAELADYSTRKYPVRIEHPSACEVKLHIILPEGAKITETPGAFTNAASKAGSVTTSFRHEGNEAWFYSRTILNESWINPKDFKEIKKLAAAKAASILSGLIYILPPEKEPVMPQDAESKKEAETTEDDGLPDGLK